MSDIKTIEMRPDLFKSFIDSVAAEKQYPFALMFEADSEFQGETLKIGRFEFQIHRDLTAAESILSEMITERTITNSLQGQYNNALSEMLDKMQAYFNLSDRAATMKFMQEREALKRLDKQTDKQKAQIEEFDGFYLSNMEVLSKMRLANSGLNEAFARQVLITGFIRSRCIGYSEYPVEKVANLPLGIQDQIYQFIQLESNKGQPLEPVAPDQNSGEQGKAEGTDAQQTNGQKSSGTLQLAA